MMRELIEYAISMDGMITAERTLYIMDMVEAESKHELGAPLDRGSSRSRLRKSSSFSRSSS